jgi:hypothetical protein
MLLVGYFEGIGSQRGIAWRCGEVAVHALKLALRDFGELIMKEAWTLSNSRAMSVRDASRLIG